MIINRYRANSIKLAIEKVNAEMGPEAKILHVRQLNASNSNSDRNSTSERIEIIAVVDDDIANKNSKANKIDLTIDEDVEQESIKKTNITQENIFKNKQSPYGIAKKYSLNRLNQNNESPLNNNIKNSSHLPYFSDDEIPDENNFNESDNALSSKELGNESENFEPLDNLKGDMWLSLASKRNLSDSQVIKNDTKIPDVDVKITSSQRQNMQRSRSRISYILHDCLVKNQVDSEYTYDILSLLNEPQEYTKEMTARDYLEVFINRRIKMSGGLDESKKVSILIGPTGVGKTTTLAKLAAQYHFQKEKSVGLITIDAYRIAAIDQLKTYAHIMSLPLKVALTPEELEKCINDYEDMDIILVDTPGRSQLNTIEIRNIEEFLEAAQPADTHLLIPTSLKESDSIACIETFAPDYVQNLLFTKLDETLSFGSIINVCMKARKPISYLTTGQNVPDDIKLAEVNSLVDLFINKKRIGRLI